MFISQSKLRRVLNRAARFVGCGPIAFPPIPLDGEIRFYKRDRPDFGFLSNFFVAPVTINGVTWAQTEAYYQAQKSANPDYHARIQESDKPSWSKYVGDSRIGHPKLAKKSWFRQHPDDLRADWDNVKLDVMRVALQAKFTQHDFLRRSLLNTRDSEIIEDSASDYFWGEGQDGSGDNWLGRLLMDLRVILTKTE